MIVFKLCIKSNHSTLPVKELMSLKFLECSSQAPVPTLSVGMPRPLVNKQSERWKGEEESNAAWYYKMVL